MRRSIPLIRSFGRRVELKFVGKLLQSNATECGVCHGDLCAALRFGVVCGCAARAVRPKESEGCTKGLPGHAAMEDVVVHVLPRRRKYVIGRSRPRGDVAYRLD